MKKIPDKQPTLPGILILLLFSLAGNAYPATDPAESTSLTEGADAVIKDHLTHFTVLSPEKGVLKVQYTITILNKKGDDQARLVVHYDKLKKVKSLEGEAFNAAGKRIEKLRKSDIEDRSNFQSFTVFADNRIKTAAFSIHTYPYTVYWEYEIETTNMMFYPTWVPQDAERLAVEKASFQVEVPAGTSFRYKEQLVKPASIRKNEKTDHYSWEVRELKAVERESLSPGIQERIPLVYTAPSAFSVEGFAGNMDSWKSYGEWINQLNQNRNDLSPEAKARIIDLTSDLSTEKEKVRVVYKYLQQNTRYVSIQLGIGGWQPFKASFVDEKGYGDCKALSNYTKAMLEAINIPSYYTLIRHGRNRDYLKEDFPMSNFDHVILCVPLAGDTIWLECTSQTNPFGFLGSGTAGRKVVLAKEEGGVIAQTSQYTAKDNLQQTIAQVDIRTEKATATIRRIYTGIQFENGGLAHYLHQSREEQKKWIYRNLKIPSYTLLNHELLLTKDDAIPEAAFSAEVELKSLVSASGRRLFINPNLANRLENTPKVLENRQTDFVLSWAYLDMDSVSFHLPEGYQAEFIPAPILIESPFGAYEARMEIEGEKLLYTRKLKVKEGRYPKEAYADYVQFMQEVSRADQAKAVLVQE